MKIKGKILVVDDDVDILQVISLRLQKSGLQVITEHKASNTVNTAIDVKPDVILLDIKMPEVDGYSVYQRIKEEAQLQDIPILFITALPPSSYSDKIHALGGIEVISKPYDPEQLKRKVMQYIDANKE